MTRHCWKCGQDYGFARTPGRSETCVQCQSDLRVCRNCVSYDRSVAYQCRDRRADPVEDKAAATYCEYFEFVKRVYRPADPEKGAPDREATARENLKRLLG